MFGLMVALDEKFEDHQSQWVLASGDHEFGMHVKVVNVFQSGPTLWTKLQASVAIHAAIMSKK